MPQPQSPDSSAGDPSQLDGESTGRSGSPSAPTAGSDFDIGGGVSNYCLSLFDCSAGATSADSDNAIVNNQIAASYSVQWVAQLTVPALAAHPAAMPGATRQAPAWVAPQSTDVACNLGYAVDFAHAHAPDAAIVATELGVPTANILGLSGAESTFGAGKFVQNGGNNFFSLQGNANSPYANGVQHSGGGTSLSTFPSYLASARSFAAQYGGLVMGKSDPTEFAQALVPRFNSGQAPLGNPNFVRDTANAIQMAGRRMACPVKH